MDRKEEILFTEDQIIETETLRWMINHRLDMQHLIDFLLSFREDVDEEEARKIIKKVQAEYEIVSFIQQEIYFEEEELFEMRRELSKLLQQLVNKENAQEKSNEIMAKEKLYQKERIKLKSSLFNQVVDIANSRVKIDEESVVIPIVSLSKMAASMTEVRELVQKYSIIMFGRMMKVENVSNEILTMLLDSFERDQKK